MANEHIPDELFRLTRIIDHLHPGVASDAADLTFAIDALIVCRLNDALNGSADKPSESSGTRDE